VWELHGLPPGEEHPEEANPEKGKRQKPEESKIKN